jgi:hypothetical protein
MLRDCDSGANPPVWYQKLKKAGDTVSCGRVDTVSVTATVTGLLLAPLAVSVIVPL